MLHLANVFGAHMVLQQGKDIAIFGEADGEVTVALGGHSATAQASGGRFLAKLPPMRAGGPHTLTVRCGGETATIEDVMIGEVWLCGGQSNMEFRLRDEQHFAEANALTDARIRFYEQPQAATSAQAQAMEVGARWIPLEAGRCADVSAVALYAAREMAQRLDVAVGMIICCIGGTSASCWMSERTLTGFAEGRLYLEEFHRLTDGKSDAQFERESAEYQAAVDRYNADYEAEHRAHPERSRGEIEASLGGFPWPPPFGRTMLRRPAGPYETMLRRLAPYTMRGFLYYQGEQDAAVDRAKGYGALFAQLIAQWRALFDDEGLVCIAAQLPGYGADAAQEDWPTIRAAQRRVIDQTDNAALACLIDLGERDNIHPADKRTPGGRMGALALAHAYGLDVLADAPRVAGAALRGDTLTLTCRETGGAMTLRGDALSALRVEGAALTDVRVCGEEIALTLAHADGRVRVAYAQENWPKAAFFGESGQPLFPFDIEIDQP